MNNEEYSLLSAVKKFFIMNSSQHMLNKIVKFFMKNCDSNRNFVKFVSKIL